jgi:hypothetical protein
MTTTARTAAAVTGRLQLAQLAVMRLAELEADIDHVQAGAGRAVIVLRHPGRLADHLDSAHLRHWSVSSWRWCELDDCIVWWPEAKR